MLPIVPDTDCFIFSSWRNKGGFKPSEKMCAGHPNVFFSFGLCTPCPEPSGHRLPSFSVSAAQTTLATTITTATIASNHRHGKEKSECLSPWHNLSQVDGLLRREIGIVGRVPWTEHLQAELAKPDLNNQINTYTDQAVGP